jgi:Rieske Fe-S protein
VPRKVAIKDSRMDAWTKYPQTVIGAVWVVRGEDDKFTAFSVICPHLGCGIDWDKDSGRFICPCHESYFDIKGEVLSGPSPRRMDTLETDIKQGKLFVRYQKMKLGIAEKTPA